MIRSIILTLGFFSLIQLSCTSAVALQAGESYSSLITQSIYISVYHAIIAVVLLKYRNLFTITGSNTALVKINLANRITLFRISSLPTVYVLFEYLYTPESAIIFPITLALLFLSDAADGFTARKLHQITYIGQRLDSIGDYALIGLISVLYLRAQLLPQWLFAVILFRLLFQGAGMLVFILLQKPIPMRSTPGGKISIASIMILYVMELVKLTNHSGLLPALRFVELSTGLLIALLLFEKLYLFVRQASLKNAESQSSQPCDQ